MDYSTSSLGSDCVTVFRDLTLPKGEKSRKIPPLTATSSLKCKYGEICKGSARSFSPTLRTNGSSAPQYDSPYLTRSPSLKLSTFPKNLVKKNLAAKKVVKYPKKGVEVAKKTEAAKKTAEKTAATIEHCKS